MYDKWIWSIFWFKSVLLTFVETKLVLFNQKYTNDNFFTTLNYLFYSTKKYLNTNKHIKKG